MIVRLSVENWMSFRDKVSFSMVASRERQHRERVPKIDKYDIRILPISAIYGGNASGKTNFFKALSFVKDLVVEGTRPGSPILVEPFQLDAEAARRPSRFVLELLVGGKIYEFSLTATRETIIEERLVELTSTTERVLYDRKGGSIDLDPSLEKDPRLQFTFQGTRDNQLFLNNSVSQKVDTFRQVYDWFNDSLELIAPDSRFALFEQFLDEGNPLYDAMNELLPRLDTGITHLGGEAVPFETIAIRDSLKTRLQENVKEGMAVKVVSEPEAFVLTRKKGELVAKKLFTYHPKSDQSRARFDLSQESDGSQRIINLLPAFLEASLPDSNRVYVIDEIDRSLHTLLTRQLIEAYLSRCSTRSRSQLLMTTHDVLLMDQQLLRRDEMWVAERDAQGASSLLSFGEYKEVRYDKDIRKSYLQGRLGGIPHILLGGGLSSLYPARENQVKD